MSIQGRFLYPIGERWRIVRDCPQSHGAGYAGSSLGLSSGSGSRPREASEVVGTIRLILSTFSFQPYHNIMTPHVRQLATTSMFILDEHRFLAEDGTVMKTIACQESPSPCVTSHESVRTI
jgi:hypothetical protein